MRNAARVLTTIDISADDENTPGIDISDWSAGSVTLPATVTGTALEFQVTNDETSAGVPQNWHGLQTEANAAVSALTVANADQFPIHDEVFHFKWMRIQMDAQAADRQIILFFKAQD